jgi:hypothetical protein
LAQRAVSGVAFTGSSMRCECLPWNKQACVKVSDPPPSPPSYPLAHTLLAVCCIFLVPPTHPICMSCCPPILNQHTCCVCFWFQFCREDAFQEYVELETVYLDCLEAAAQGSANSGGVGSHTDFGEPAIVQLQPT